MELAGPGCNCIVTADEDNPAPGTDASGASSGGCAIDPQNTSGSALPFMALPFLLALRRRVAQPGPI
jgi:hypothetical protein